VASTAAMESVKPVENVNVNTQNYNAVTQGVNDNALVQNQLNKVIDPANPLMQRAKTRALQTANSRGLVNSSMAVGAAESAMIEAATPIAVQDAGTHFQQDSASAKNVYFGVSEFKKDITLGDDTEEDALNHGLSINTGTQNNTEAKLSLKNGSNSATDLKTYDDGSALHLELSKVSFASGKGVFHAYGVGAYDNLDIGSNASGNALISLGLSANTMGFYANSTPVAKQTVTGSKGGNAALSSLITALANLGLITDSTT